MVYQFPAQDNNMAFLVRIVEALILVVLVFTILLTSLTIAVFVVNRGLQLFFRLFGYEVGDFFGWLMKQLHIKKVKKEEIDGKNT